MQQVAVHVKHAMGVWMQHEDVQFPDWHLRNAFGPFLNLSSTVVEFQVCGVCLEKDAGHSGRDTS